MGKYSQQKGDRDAEAGKPFNPPTGGGLVDPLFGTKAGWKECEKDYTTGYKSRIEKSVLEHNREKDKRSGKS